ncbi:MAG TPA: CPBP family intramembrane glutamic endopeptidase, partial [Bryobacteraceae bacterium]
LMLLAPLTMFVPALGVLAARITSDAHLSIEWNRFPLRWIPGALLILPLAIHAVALPAVARLEGGLPWAPWLTPQPDGLYHAPQELGWGSLTLGALAGRLAINAVTGLVIVSILAFFEEVGWRGFMLPRLVRCHGVRGGAAASALVWALWHIPFAASGILHVNHVSTLGLMLISPAGHFGAGLFLAFLWLKTRSIALVSLAHGAFNNWGQYAFKFMNTTGERDLTLFALVNVTVLAVGVGAFTRSPSR